MVSNIYNCVDIRGEEYLYTIFQDIALSMGTTSVVSAIDILRDILRELDIKSPVSTNREGDLKILSTSVNQVRLMNNPVRVETLTIKSLYNNIII